MISNVEMQDLKMYENMAFKERLLSEYNDLICKCERLDNYIREYNKEPNFNKEYEEVMQRQMDAMMNYKTCIERRILMIMNGDVQ